MTTLRHAVTQVILKSSPAAFRDQELAEPYGPSLLEEAEDTGYRVGLEDGRPSSPSWWPQAARIRYAVGRHHGVVARETRAAYDLGHALGVETDLGEPPGGLAPHEAAAYREGFADAQREEEAWLDERAREREEEAFGDPADRLHDCERTGTC